MGGKKKYTKQTQQSQKQTPGNNKDNEDDKRFVNLLHVYTIYKQKFRRLSKGEFEELLRHGSKGKRAAMELCKEFMKAKQIPNEVNFFKNVGFLSAPRFMPLIALLAERAEYKITPSIVSQVDFSKTPTRFQEKFSHLLVYGFWFLGRVISDSLSVKEQVNRGNIFNFLKGDLGFWWAGVRILDWNYYAQREDDPESCHSFVVKDPQRYRYHTTRAILNMHHHPLFFLSELDWSNYKSTVQTIRHAQIMESSTAYTDSQTPSDEQSSSIWSSSGSDLSSLSSEGSLNTMVSRESID